MLILGKTISVKCYYDVLEIGECLYEEKNLDNNKCLYGDCWFATYSVKIWRFEI